MEQEKVTVVFEKTEFDYLIALIDCYIHTELYPKRDRIITEKKRYEKNTLANRIKRVFKKGEDARMGGLASTYEEDLKNLYHMLDVANTVKRRLLDAMPEESKTTP